MEVKLIKELKIWGDPTLYTPNGKKPSIEALRALYKKSPEKVKVSVKNWKQLLFPKEQKKE